jgi:hypothetical protein
MPVLGSGFERVKTSHTAHHPFQRRSGRPEQSNLRTGPLEAVGVATDAQIHQRWAGPPQKRFRTRDQFETDNAQTPRKTCKTSIPGSNPGGAISLRIRVMRREPDSRAVRHCSEEFSLCSSVRRATFANHCIAKSCRCAKSARLPDRRARSGPRTRAPAGPRRPGVPPAARGRSDRDRRGGSAG